jgi:hypothetical protein
MPLKFVTGPRYTQATVGIWRIPRPPAVPRLKSVNYEQARRPERSVAEPYSMLWAA